MKVRTTLMTWLDIVSPFRRTKELDSNLNQLFMIEFTVYRWWCMLETIVTW